MSSDTLAAIDIGSNAVRLLINNVEAGDSGYAFKKAAYLRVPLRLGEDVFTRRRVSDAKAALLVEAMQGFTHIMRAYSVAGFRACATSAMRDADNGDALVSSIREKAGIDIEIISGRQEAELIYAAGAMRNVAGCAGACMFVDVGGGSTEVVVYGDGQMRFYDSFQIGTVRMLSNAVEKTEKARFAHSLSGICAHYAPEDIVASGGNINKAFKLLGKKAGDPLSPGDLDTLCARLKALTFKDRMRVFGLNPYRADVIVPALEIFLRITGQCPSVRDIHVPKIGLADGLIRDMHKKRLQANQ